jgi:hypothetical protein
MTLTRNVDEEARLVKDPCAVPPLGHGTRSRIRPKVFARAGVHENKDCGTAWPLENKSCQMENE